EGEEHGEQSVEPFLAPPLPEQTTEHGGDAEQHERRLGTTSADEHDDETCRQERESRPGMICLPGRYRFHDELDRLPRRQEREADAERRGGLEAVRRGEGRHHRELRRRQQRKQSRETPQTFG